MEYLKSRAHLHALLIEEGIQESEKYFSCSYTLRDAESKANSAFQRTNSKGNSVSEIAEYFRKTITEIQSAQSERRKQIDAMQEQIDAYERVILRLCPPPPPPTPEEELQRIKLRMCELIDSECSGDEIKAELEKLTEVVF